jgi:hypothetical protein
VSDELPEVIPDNKEYFIEKEFEEGIARATLVITPREPIVELTLSWSQKSFLTEGRDPDTWEIVWFHHPDIIWDNLETYLAKFCPAPKQVFEAARAMHGRMMSQAELYGKL